MNLNSSIEAISTDVGIGLRARNCLNADEVLMDGCPPKESLGLVILHGPEARNIILGNSNLQSRMLQVGPSAWWGTAEEENLFIRIRLGLHLSSFPDDHLARLTHAWTYLEEYRNNWREFGDKRADELALDSINLAFELGGKSESTFRMLAVYHTLTGDFDNALKSCDEALTRSKSNNLRIQKSYILALAGQSQHALQLSEHATKGGCPGWHYFVLGLSQFFAHDIEEARHSFSACHNSGLRDKEDEYALHQSDFNIGDWGYSDFVRERQGGKRARYQDSFLSYSQVLLESKAYLAASEALCGNDHAANKWLNLVDAINPNFLGFDGWRERNKYLHPDNLEFILEGLGKAGMRGECRLPRQRFLNHSCAPNVYFDSDFCFRTLREVPLGETLAFDYTTTDEHIIPFDCKCGAPTCAGRIKGFSTLTIDEQLGRLPRLSPHLKQMRSSTLLSSRS